MNAKRISLLVAAGLSVTGCGMAALTASTAHRAATVKDGLSLTRVPAAPPATAAPTATPAPPPPPQVLVIADESGSTTLAVYLVDTAGHLLAQASVPADARWTFGAGNRAAYWVSGGRLQRLDTNGRVTTLATVPSTESGSVVLSPDGSQWAYATTSTNAQGVITNRLYRGAPNQPAQLIAERTADPAHPAPDTPGPWQYYPMSWTSRGILIERQPVGGCGCGTPFDMQMTAGYTALIDPVTGNATTLATSPTCPLSGIGADATLACFQTNASGASASVAFMNGPQTTHRYLLSGTTDGGDATFDGATVAYATVPSTAGGCGGPDWRPQTTLHVMDVATGDARVVGRTGLAPLTWLDDGSLLAQLNTISASQTTSSLVAVDPTSGAVRPIFSRASDFVGVA